VKAWKDGYRATTFTSPKVSQNPFKVESYSLGRESVRQIFLQENDVVHVRMGKKKKNAVMLILRLVAERVHRGLQNF
jgi:hypothetical protein